MSRSAHGVLLREIYSRSPRKQTKHENRVCPIVLSTPAALIRVWCKDRAGYPALSLLARNLLLPIGELGATKKAHNLLQLQARLFNN